MTHPDSEHGNFVGDGMSTAETQQCWMNAIILCTKPGSTKHTGIVNHLATSKFGDTPIIPMTPHRVAETEFNHYTTRAHIVAAMKTLQAPQDPGPMLLHTIGASTTALMMNQEPVIVATDVMLDIKHRGHTWLAHNKPDPASSRDDLFAMLMSMISPVNAGISGLIDARLRVGAAALCVDSKRGIAGTTETFITFNPLEPNVIQQYLNQYSTSELPQTNAAIRWEHPIFRSRMHSINGIPIDDPAFADEFDILVRQAQGALPEIGDLLTQANRFRRSGATGQLHEVTSVAREIFPQQEVGRWGVWYT